MRVGSARWRRLSVALSALAAVGVAGSAAVLAGACIIADPPGNLPKPTVRPPTILRSFPPSTAVLGKFPDQFVLEVEADPTQAVKWNLFVDYDPFTGGGLAGSDTVFADPGAPNAGTRQISLVATELTNPSTSRCHVIEALVALGFEGLDGRDAHTFDSRGGDSVTWFYSPTGDLSGCPVLDAGVDGAFPDAPSDALLVPKDGGAE